MLQYIYSRGYSQVVSRLKGRLRLTTSSGITRWLAAGVNAGEVPFESATLGDVLPFDREETMQLLSRDASIDEALAIFQQSLERKRPRLFAIVITESGDAAENPLGIISNAAFALKQESQEGQAASGETVGIIRDEVMRSDRIISQLMNYARLSEGRVESLDANEVLGSVAKQVRPSALGGKVRIVTRLAGGLPRIPAQRAELECGLTADPHAIAPRSSATPRGGPSEWTHDAASN